MRILIAPDSFKGSLTSIQAAAAIAAGIRSVRPDVEIITVPLADGGEGTRDVPHTLYGGEIDGETLYFEDEGRYCALIESAALIGLTVPSMQGDVFERGSAALGKALRVVLHAGVQDIRITLGGTATVDGGLGFLMALGCRVLDCEGESVSTDLNGLMQARKIETAGLSELLNGASITILLDVQNPLCGMYGAVYMYGAQKGLKNAQMSSVEAAMRQWALLCEQEFALCVQSSSGAGAAGGMGFALQLLGNRCDVSAVSGAEQVMRASRFDQLVKTVDWVITGEGRSDDQTLNGKLPLMVAENAKKAGVSTALIAGEIDDEQALRGYFDSMINAKPDGVSAAQAMQDAEYYVIEAAKRWARCVL